MAKSAVESVFNTLKDFYWNKSPLLVLFIYVVPRLLILAGFTHRENWEWGVFLSPLYLVSEAIFILVSLQVSLYFYLSFISQRTLREYSEISFKLFIMTNTLVNDPKGILKTQIFKYNKEIFVIDILVINQKLSD